MPAPLNEGRALRDFVTHCSIFKCIYTVRLYHQRDVQKVWRCISKNLIKFVPNKSARSKYYPFSAQAYWWRRWLQLYWNVAWLLQEKNHYRHGYYVFVRKVEINSTTTRKKSLATKLQRRIRKTRTARIPKTKNKVAIFLHKIADVGVFECFG